MVCADCGQEIWIDQYRINSWYSYPSDPAKSREFVCRYEFLVEDGELAKMTMADYHSPDLEHQRHYRLIDGKVVTTVGPLSE